MGGGGGKGGGSSGSVKIDPRLQEGAVQAMTGSLRSAALPYRTNRGVSIAAFSPEQLAAFQGANSAASAYGFGGSGHDEGTYLPTPELGAGGVLGYSTGALYDENVARSLSDKDINARNKLLESYANSAEKIDKKNTNPDLNKALLTSINSSPPQSNYTMPMGPDSYKQKYDTGFQIGKGSKELVLKMFSGK